MGALIGQQRTHRCVLAGVNRRHAGLSGIGAGAGRRARGHRRGAKQHADDRGGLDVGELLAQLRQMAAGDMAGLMREHADDLVRRGRFGERAGVDEDAAAVDHEGVERLVVDQDDLQIGLRQARDPEDRRGIVAHQLLDFGVADQRHAAALLCGRGQRRNRQRDRGHRNHQAGGRLCDGCPDRTVRSRSLCHNALELLLPTGH